MKALELAERLIGRPAVYAEPAATELRRLAEVNAELLGMLEAIKRLYRGGRFDLTDSPKSFISTVIRLCEESEQTIKAKAQQ